MSARNPAPAALHRRPPWWIGNLHGGLRGVTGTGPVGLSLPARGRFSYAAVRSLQCNEGLSLTLARAESC